MATDTSFGEVRKFEDFNVTAIADLPEIDFQDNTGAASAIISGGADGRFRMSVENSDDDDVTALTFGNLTWTAGDGYLKMEARIILSSVADNHYFVGFGDSLATADETVMFATTDTVATGTQSDSIGILWDGDATTAQLWAVGQKTDVVTVEEGLGTSDVPVAATPTTLGVYLSLDRKSAVFYKDGKEVHRIDSSTTLVAAVDLVPGVWALEQGTAYNLDIDYLYGSKGRSAT